MEKMPSRRDFLKGIAGITAASLAMRQAEAAPGNEDSLRELREELAKLQTLRDEYIEAQKNEDRPEQQRLEGEIGETIKKVMTLDKQLGPK